MTDNDTPGRIGTKPRLNQTTRPGLRGIGRVLALAVIAAQPALAQDEDYDVTLDLAYESYTVDGNDLTELQSAMAANGPQGFWAYTTWQANWTADCDVTVTANIILPELGNDSDLLDEDVAEWDRMIAALDEHELGHVDIGLQFAQEVFEAGCQGDTDAMLAPWTEYELGYDAETEHGRTQGVYLESR